MIKRYIEKIALLTVVMLSACTQRIDVPVGQDIALSASVVDVEQGTKSSAYVGSVPSAAHPLHADLWFSRTSGDYSVAVPSDDKTYVPCHTSAVFNSENITLITYGNDANKTLKYPTDDKSVYCIGLYPSNVWTWNGGKITASITGEQDLMFAHEIKGKWNEQFGAKPENSQQFRHLLTWIKVVLCATSYEAVSSWGAITKVDLINTPASITTDKVDGSEYKYNGSQNLVLMNSESGKDLSLLKTEAGSVFCAPSSALTLSVTTKDGRVVNKNFEASFEAGKQYILVLYFNELSVIDGFCTLASWENQNENLYVTDNEAVL